MKSAYFRIHSVLKQTKVKFFGGQNTDQIANKFNKIIKKSFNVTDLLNKKVKITKISDL